MIKLWKKAFPLKNKKWQNVIVNTNFNNINLQVQVYFLEVYCVDSIDA